MVFKVKSVRIKYQAALRALRTSLTFVLFLFFRPSHLPQSAARRDSSPGSWRLDTGTCLRYEKRKENGNVNKENFLFLTPRGLCGEKEVLSSSSISFFEKAIGNLWEKSSIPLLGKGRRGDIKGPKMHSESGQGE